MLHGTLRTTYKHDAQLAIRAISKVTEVYKREQSSKPSFCPEGAVVFDELVMSFKGLTTVSLFTIHGRVLVTFRIGGYQASRPESIKGQADVIYRTATC